METPVALVQACAVLLPRLTAEESFLAASRVAVGTGSLAAEDAHGLTAEWARLAERARTSVRRRPSPADLAAIGVQTIEVPRG